MLSQNGTSDSSQIKPTINFTLQKYSAKERKPNKIGQEQKPSVSGFL